MSAPTRGLYVLGGDLPESVAVPLTTVLERDADQTLEAALDRIDERVATDVEAQLDEPVDPTVLDLIEAVCGEPDTVVELTLLQRHVADGDLTWSAVWAAPWDHAGGMRLVREVLTRASVSDHTDQSPQAAGPE